MAERGRVVVPNQASRWCSIIFWLIWLLGLYGVVSSRAWPPTRGQDWLPYLGLVLLPVLAVRSLRARVVLDARGFTSYDESRHRSFTWAQVTGFSERGHLVQNKVGADLVDGSWVRLQYHPFASDMVRRLQAERTRLLMDRPAAGSG